MIVPTVHLNGSGRKSLLDGLERAGSALHEAIKALDDIAPNGRDYYPQGEGAFKQASAEHQVRVARLAGVLHELSQIAEAIADA
jgi:hypothetical protein